jgi:hypothetical protein
MGMKKYTFGGMSLTQHLVHIVISAVCLYFISEPTHLTENLHSIKFLKSLGEAGLIALVIIYLIEMQSHKRLEKTAEKLISKVGRRFFGLVYGHDLPDELIRAVENNTLDRPVYREHMDMQYELTAKNIRTGKNSEIVTLCEIASLQSYKLFNCAEDPVDIPVRIYLERDKWLISHSDVPKEHTEPLILYVQIGTTIYLDEESRDKVIAKRGPLQASLNVKPLKPLVTTKDEGNKLYFEIDKISLPGKSELSISYAGVLHKRNSDNELWTTSYSTLKTNLSITSNDYDINVDFPSDHEPNCTRTGMNSRWMYNEVLLKGQAITFWWLPKQ